MNHSRVKWRDITMNWTTSNMDEKRRHLLRAAAQRLKGGAAGLSVCRLDHVRTMSASLTVWAAREVKVKLKHIKLKMI